jgi:hypothetical protein
MRRSTAGISPYPRQIRKHAIGLLTAEQEADEGLCKPSSPGSNGCLSKRPQRSWPAIPPVLKRERLGRDRKQPIEIKIKIRKTEPSALSMQARFCTIETAIPCEHEFDHSETRLLSTLKRAFLRQGALAPG